MLVAFIGPLALFFQYSFYTFRDGTLYDELSTAAYAKFLTDPFYWGIVWNSIQLAGLVTAIAVLVGYPLAYALSRLQHPGVRKWAVVIIFSPLVVSVVVRSYGWMILLSDQGAVNWALLGLGLIGEPIKLIFNSTGVVISLVHIFLPFVVFPIYSVMLRLDPSLKEASRDLGAGWWTTFRRVTLPLTLPGVAAAAQICFTLGLGAFVTPALLGGGRVQVLPLNVYTNTVDINWPMAAVGGLVLLALALVVVAGSNRLIQRWAWEQ
jgi:putative spermidine/putrescine transport system permease protein